MEKTINSMANDQIQISKLSLEFRVWNLEFEIYPSEGGVFN